MPCPKCPDGLADTLTDPLASPALGMATSKPLAHLAQPCTLCFLPFLWVCPADACDVPMRILLRLRGIGCLQLLRCSAAVWEGLPSVTALNFNQQRWGCAIEVHLGSGCHTSLPSELSCLSRVWLSLGRPAEPLFTCAAAEQRITQWDVNQGSESLGFNLPLLLSWEAVITGDNAALGLPCHCPVVSY